MAELAGHGGNAYYHSSTSKAAASVTSAMTGAKAWTLDYGGDALETTDFSDSGDRTYIGGLKGWTGTIEYNYSASSTLSVNSTGTLKLAMSSSATHYAIGNILVTGKGLNTAVDGIISQTITFQGTGSLSIT